MNARAVADCLGPVVDHRCGEPRILDKIPDIVISPLPVLTTMASGLANSIAELFAQTPPTRPNSPSRLRALSLTGLGDGVDRSLATIGQAV